MRLLLVIFHMFIWKEKAQLTIKNNDFVITAYLV